MLFAKLSSKERLEMQGAVVNGCDDRSNSSGGGGVTELEVVLKQKRFTRQVTIGPNSIDFKSIVLMQFCTM